MKRKQIRLKNWNYGNTGAYFITICVKDRKHLFGPVGADSISAQMIYRTFNEVIEKYSNVYCSKYVIITKQEMVNLQWKISAGITTLAMW